MRPNRLQFFFSIFTALASGVGLAFVVIIGARIVNQPHLISDIYSKTAAVSKGITSGITHTFSENIFNISLEHIFSKHFLYEALAEEDVGDDITFKGESLTAAVANKEPIISALAYSVQSLDKDNVLIEKDSDRLLPIASVTKLITAVMAKKLFKEDDVVGITPSVLKTEGTTGKFREGERFKIKEILYPLLMVSSNDAAEAISQAYDAKQGKGKFVKEMNNWVSEIGAYRTYFKDASGLSPQNVSTARDLSLVAKWIKENEPEIFTITMTKAKTIRTHTWTNPTHFLSLSSYTGGKNGYIPEASLTNVSLFELGTPKRLYSVVLLGSKSRDKDTLSVLNKAVK